ncbi:UDP-glycosyltransferase 92A1 [Prunus yedoensis var. nudiflora]|uniref:UDP-glycosyltransferase 92A1 n=1 Tax=Prunus yedoensis var. nudiflora TaxID=2094558 RepID=A0A314UDZ4_PRUYE|nr:UDP-glycosyltransferase 92A1 [Prunus yedoensis var. nudiflora]
MEGQEHIVMLPFMAQGHLIPFLALARKIQQRTGFAITIASTTLNIQYLTFILQYRLWLAPNAENTEDLPLSKIGDLLAASTSLEAPAHRLILDIIAKEGRPPLCIVSDMYFGWAANLANNLSTVHVTFTTGGAYGSAALVSIWLSLPHRCTASDEFPVPGFPESYRFHISQLNPYLKAADGKDSGSRIFQPQISLSTKSFGWLCSTVEAIEPFGLEILRNYLRLPVWSIGPLLPIDALKNFSTLDSSVSRQRAGKELGIPAETCLKWLDSHGSDSVIYISFGSQNTISATQMMELAIALEERRVQGRVVAPRIRRSNEQKKTRVVGAQLGTAVGDFVSHKSTSVFVSHCGWNSVMESLSQGVPIIGWPLGAEQAFNSKMLVEEMGVSVELTRGGQSDIARKEVKRLIDLVMDKSGKGGEMREKACEIKEQIRAAIREEAEDKGSFVKAMDDFVATILSTRQGL